MNDRFLGIAWGLWHTEGERERNKCVLTHTEAAILGCLTQGLRNTMTRGHLAVMKPFVCGNSHFPVSSQGITAVI